MATRKQKFASVLFLALLWPAGGARGSTNVTAWSFGTGVTDFSGPDTITDAQFSSIVINPFSETHDTFLPPAELAITEFAFAWNEAADLGSFEVDFEQGLTLGSHRTTTSGMVFATSTVPLLLDLNVVMNFTSSSADEASFLLSVNVLDFDTFEVFFADLQLAGAAHFGEPASGTLTMSAEDLLIPAGANLLVDYQVRALSPFAAPLLNPMFTDGFINWSFRPVPEPTTAALICLALPIVLRRRR